MRRPDAARLVAAVVLTAAASAAVPLPLAEAAACSSADGVSVVVDFKGLGGGVQQACDAAGAGKTAASLFTDNGFPLTYVQRQPGFVCRVSGAPADDPCVNTPPADAYWGVWWSDGESGSWTYASQGVGSLKVPAGGYVALAWDGSSGTAAPSVSPAPHAAEPSPQPSQQPTRTPPASPQPTSAPTPTPASGAGSDPTSGAAQPDQGTSPSGTPSPSASGSADPSASPSVTSDKPDQSPSATATATATASGSAGDTGEPASSDVLAADDDGLPSWVAPALIGVLFSAAGVAAFVRRRRGSTGP